MQTAHIRQILFGILLADIHLIFDALLTHDKLRIINFVQVYWYGLFLAEIWVPSWSELIPLTNYTWFAFLFKRLFSAGRGICTIIQYSQKLPCILRCYRMCYLPIERDFSFILKPFTKGCLVPRLGQSPVNLEDKGGKLRNMLTTELSFWHTFWWSSQNSL